MASSQNTTPLPPTPTTLSSSKAKKHKKKKKAATQTSTDSPADAASANHLRAQIGEDVGNLNNDINGEEEDSDNEPPEPHSSSKITSKEERASSNLKGGFASSSPTTEVDNITKANEDTQARLDALLQEREALREEVTSLRKSLEDIQSQGNEHVDSLNDQIIAERSEKETAQEQYQSLLGRVNTLKTQLTERLKADAEQLAEARTEIEQLHSQNASLQEQVDSQTAEVLGMVSEREEQSKELSTLRNRTTLSQQNWNEERDDLVQREAAAREEFDNAKQAMQDWEILAMEERDIRQGLKHRVTELEEEIETQKSAYEKAREQRDMQANTVEGLQKGLQEIQEARKQELREIVEKSQSEIASLRKNLDDAQASESASKDQLDDMQGERDRLLPLEAELKEKNLLIGKLRHEAVILNDHLTKALRQLKRGKTEDVIDRQLVTNHFLQFLTLGHGDPKKFQILQIIAAMLNWADEQREQAGLARPGASNPNLRNPISPWTRTPSTPTLNAANLGAYSGETGARKDSIAGLFSEFLESEAEGGSSKATSVSESSRPTS